MEASPYPTSFRKILVLCIDRDNDVGEKLGVPTPIVGRDNILRVATQYILRFPDDSDANAMFAAIQLYDNLVASLGRENVEVALVTGASSEDTMADLKLLDEVNKVLSQFNADAFIVVSDSPSDEAVVPLLQSRRPVISIRRVVVRQSRRFEEFAVLAKYYLSKLFVEPRYRRYALGLPGLLLLLAGIVSIASMYIPPTVAVFVTSAILILFGVAAIIYALNLHQDILRFIRKYELTFFTVVVALLLAVLYPVVMTSVLGLAPTLLLTRRPTVFDVMSIALAITLLTNIVEVYAKRGLVPYRRILTAVVTSLFPALILNSAVWFSMGVTTFFTLVISVAAYLGLSIVTLLLLSRVLRRHGMQITSHSS